MNAKDAAIDISHITSRRQIEQDERVAKGIIDDRESTNRDSFGAAAAVVVSNGMARFERYGLLAQIRWVVDGLGRRISLLSWEGTVTAGGSAAVVRQVTLCGGVHEVGDHRQNPRA